MRGIKIADKQNVGKKAIGGFAIFKNNFELLILTIPALLGFFIFNYLPMFGVVLAFKEYNYRDGIFGSPWIGFENFKFFFESQDAWRVARNTVAYNATFIVVGIFSAVVIALLLYELSNRICIKVYQTAIILPRFLSWVIVSYITYILLNPKIGVFNQVLVWMGKEPIQWYAETKYWPVILTLTNIWKNVGLDSIIYFAALMGVDQELYEAAKIDGANRVKQIIHISIPSILPVMTILFVLAVGNIFGGDFGLFYQVSRDVGVLYPVTDIIPTYVFRGLTSGSYSMSTAVGLFQSVVGLILVVATNWIVKKIEPENSLF